MTTEITIANRADPSHPCVIEGPPRDMRCVPWRVYVGDLSGNEIIDQITRRPRYIQYPNAQQFCNEAEAKAHTKKFFRNITPLRAVQTDEMPGIITAVPKEWYGFGTNRMKAEIEAGIRPHSDYLLPPIVIEIPQPKERVSLWRKRLSSR